MHKCLLLLIILAKELDGHALVNNNTSEYSKLQERLQLQQSNNQPNVSKCQSESSELSGDVNDSNVENLPAESQTDSISKYIFMYGLDWSNYSYVCT